MMMYMEIKMKPMKKVVYSNKRKRNLVPDKNGLIFIGHQVADKRRIPDMIGCEMGLVHKWTDGETFFTGIIVKAERTKGRRWGFWVAKSKNNRIYREEWLKHNTSPQDKAYIYG